MGLDKEEREEVRAGGRERRAQFAFTNGCQQEGLGGRAGGSTLAHRGGRVNGRRCNCNQPRRHRTFTGSFFSFFLSLVAP